MAIVNIIYPSDDTVFESVVSDLKSYVKGYDTILKMTSTENTNVLAAADWAFGFDIIIALCKDETPTVGFFLKEPKELSSEGIDFGTLTEINPNLMAKFKICVPDAETATTVVDIIKQNIENVLSDPSRNELFRWIRDDVGSWYALPVSQAELHTKVIYDKSGFSDEVYLEFASRAYKNSVCEIEGRNENQWYLFNKNGYVYSTPGFKPVSSANKALYILDNLMLAEGWILIEGKWHLFNNRHFSEHVTMIEGQLYDLNPYGRLNEDASLFEVDPNDKYKLLRKTEV